MSANRDFAYIKIFQFYFIMKNVQNHITEKYKNNVKYKNLKFRMFIERTALAFRIKVHNSAFTAS